MSNSFWEKYKHPKWQKRRLEIMELAGFKCQSCGTGDKPLNVHHKRYLKDRDPWEYASYQLECLCEACHESRHEMMERLNFALSILDGKCLEKVYGFVASICDQKSDIPRDRHSPKYWDCVDGYVLGLLSVPPELRDEVDKSANAEGGYSTELRDRIRSKFTSQAETES